jgi:hypothetical protein
MTNYLTFLLRPDIFSITILTLYLLNAARWAYERNLGQTVYWLGAFIITSAVTFLMNGAK